MLNVMAISPPSIISALMKLCHALYNKGPKHLLCGGVRLSSEVQVMLFTNFMMTKDPSRFAHLRELELAFSLPFPLLFSDGARLRLAGLLSHPALAVETLILHNAAWVLGSGDLSDAWLCEAFGRLRVVKHLALLGVRGENEPAIRAFPSKLESVSIGVDRPLVDVHGWPRFDVLSTLRPFADTLHTLLLKLEPNAPALSLLQNSFGVDGFPHVRTFGIVYDDSVPALLASPALAQTFPALTNLQLIPPTLERSGRHRRRRLETAAGFREGNQVQRSQHEPGGSASPRLASLAECSGRLFDVYALALNHTLSTLRIWQDVVADDLPILRAVLEDTRPGHLCPSTEMRDRDVERTFAALRTLLAPKPPPRVDLNISLSDGVWHACIYKDGAMVSRSEHPIPSLRCRTHPPKCSTETAPSLLDVADIPADTARVSRVQPLHRFSTRGSTCRKISGQPKPGRTCEVGLYHRSLSQALL